MLELVVAIVVMGIAMMALPLMLTTTQKNNTFAMQQEAILIARTQLGDILTYPWDENSTNINSGISYVLDVTNGDADFNRTTNSTRRVGHVRGNRRRKFYATQIFASTTLGSETGETLPDDIDDFDNSDRNLSNASDTNSSLGYKLSDTNMTISVVYVSDDTNETNPTISFDFNTTDFNTTTALATTNIKMVTLSLKNNLLENNLTLRAFSANIGANQLLRRDF